MDGKSKFISEKTIEENRRKREEEWEKARKDNKDLPELKEEDYDPRTLFERLQEQKLKKEEAQKEASKLSNLIHTVNDDEAAFLYSLKEKSIQKEKEIELEDKEELKNFKETLNKRTQQLTEPNLSKSSIDNNKINWNFSTKKRQPDIGPSLGIVKKSKSSEQNDKSASSSSKSSLGLVAYSTDDDSDSDANNSDSLVD